MGLVVIVGDSRADELLNEFKAVFSAEGIEFPEDFDWWKRLVKIAGTTFG